MPCTRTKGSKRWSKVQQRGREEEEEDVVEGGCEPLPSSPITLQEAKQCTTTTPSSCLIMFFEKERVRVKEMRDT
jgi:hypothetical protein